MTPVPTTTASPLPWWALAVLAVAGALVGWVTARVLATGQYRIEDDEADEPPGSPWWPAPALALLFVLVGWFVGDLSHWAAAPAYLLFAWLSVALIWIDLDVHRLPVGLVWPGGAAVVLLLAVASVSAAVDGQGRWLGALIGGVVLWVLFFGLTFLPGSGFGWGDLRLAPFVGLLLGWLGFTYLQAGLIAIFVFGGISAVIALVRRRDRKADVAFGPAMCLGVFAGIVWASQIMAATTTG